MEIEETVHAKVTDSNLLKFEPTNKLTFNPDGIYIGKDNLCIEGDFGLDFEKAKTIEFKIGNKTFKYVKV